MITLASRVFEYFLRFLLLACVSCAFWLRWGFPLCVNPYFLAYPHVFLPCGPFSGVFRLYLAFLATTVVLAPITAPFLLLALRSAAFFGVFLPNFAIFALVSDYLGIFCFLPRLPLLGCLLCSACLFSSLVTCLVGQDCSPPALLTPVVFPLGVFFL